MKKITKSVLLRTLLLNMVIVAVITGFLFPLSGKIRAVMINQEVRARQTVLQTGLENFSTQLRYLEQSIVAPTQYFSRLSSQGDIKAKDAYSILLAQRYLGAVKNSTNYVLDIIVTFDKNDIILTSAQNFRSVKEFYVQNKLCSSNQENLLESRYDSPRFLGVQSAETKATMRRPISFVYIAPLHIVSNHGVQGTAFFLIDERAFLQSVMTPQLRDHGLFQVQDKEKNTIYHYAAPGIDSSQEQVKLQASALDGALQVLTDIPISYFDEATADMRLTIHVLLLLTILSGIAAAAGVAWRQAKPIKAIAFKLREWGMTGDPSADEYHQIRTGIDAFQREKQLHVLEVEKFRDALRDDGFIRLLNTRSLTDTTLESLQGQMEPLPDVFVLAYLQFYGLNTSWQERQNVEQIIALERMRRLMPGTAVLVQTSPRLAVLLYPADSQTQGVKLVSALVEEATQVLSIGAGGIVSQPLDSISRINECYENLRTDLLRHQVLTAIEPAANPVKEPSAMQVRHLQELYTALTVGNLEESQSIIEFLFLQARTQTFDIEQQYYAIRGTILMAWEDYLPDTPLALSKYSIAASPTMLLDQLNKAAKELCGCINQRVVNIKERQCQEITGYLQKNYSDPDLSISMLADKFGYSEKYLSCFYRDQTGVTPITLLHQIRMEHAAEQLLHSGSTVAEISRSSGFISYNTFLKAFKRYYGLTPGQYRDINKVALPALEKSRPGG